MPRTRLALSAALLALSALVAPIAGAAGGHLEQVVDVPRQNSIPLTLSFEKASLKLVESQNDPQPADVKEASEKDPKDLTFVLIRFRYSNDDYFKHRVKLRALLLDADGGVVAEGGRTGALDARTSDDTFSFPMKVKTVDWPKAAKMKILATFLN